MIFFGKTVNQAANRLIKSLLIVLFAILGFSAKAQVYVLKDTARLKDRISKASPSRRDFMAYLEMLRIARDASVPNLASLLNFGLQRAKEAGDQASYYRMTAISGSMSMHRGNLNQAKAELERAFQYASSTNDDTTLLYINIIRSIVIGYSSTYTEGVKIALDNLSLFQRCKIKSLEPSIYMNYAHLHGYGGSYESTSAIYRKAIKAAHKLNDTISYTTALNNLANIQINAGLIDSAFRNITIAKKLALKLNLGRILDVCDLTLIDIYYEKGDYQTTIKLLSEIKSRIRSGKSFFPAADLLMTEVPTLLKLGRYDLAIERSEEGIRDMRKRGQHLDENRFWGWLAEANVKAGHSKEAAIAIDSFFFYSGKYHDVEMMKQVNELETAYQTKEKTLKIKNMEVEQKNQALVNYLLVAVLALAALLIIAGIFTTRQLQKRKATLEAQNKVIEAQNLQLASLNNSKDRIMGIIAHDLRSPLGTLGQVSHVGLQMVEQKNYEMLSQLFAHLSTTTTNLNNLIGNLLDWSVSQEGNLSVNWQKLDVQYIWSQVELLYMEQASNKRISFATSIEPHLAAYADYNSINTILRNLLNNAIKFTQQDGNIVFTAYQEGDLVVCSISDNGKGMTAAQLESLRQAGRAHRTRGTAGEQGAGLGMLLVKELLSLNRATMTISSGVNLGTTVRIYMPCWSEQEDVREQIQNSDRKPIEDVVTVNFLTMEQSAA